MGYFFNYSTNNEFLMETCFECGIQFAFPKGLYDVLLRDHIEFCCPKGHKQYYSKKTKEEKCKEEIKRLEARLSSRENEISDLEHSIKFHQRRFNGIKGQFVKLKLKKEKHNG